MSMIIITDDERRMSASEDILVSTVRGGELNSRVILTTLRRTVSYSKSFVLFKISNMPSHAY